MRPIPIATIAVALLLPVTAEAQVLKKEPPAGQLGAGQRVLVDDGSCPAGQIKEITGGSNMTKDGQINRGGGQRTRRCIARK